MSLLLQRPRLGTALGVGVILIVAVARGQGLDGLKKSYEEEVAKTVLPLRQGYRKALLTLEQSLAAKGDYAGARQVQEARRTVEHQIGDVPTAARTNPVLETGGRLKLTTGGEGTGGLREENGAWTGWQAAGGAVRWWLPAGLAGGGYALELVYRSTGSGSLPLTVREDFHGLTRTVKVDAAVAADGRVRLGVLRMRPGASMLEVKLAGTGTPLDFRLLEVHLIPEGGGA